MPARHRTRAGRAGLGARIGLVGLVGLVGLAGGCGLPDEDSPRVIDPETVPYDLAGPAERDAPTPKPGETTSKIEVFLVLEVEGELRLVRSTREIAGPVNLDTVMGNLMTGGVTPTERDAGLMNLVPGAELRSIERRDSTAPASTAPAGVPPAATTATIDVYAEFFDRFPTQKAQLLAMGQLVLTMTNYSPARDAGSPVGLVAFTVDGRPKHVPTYRPGQSSQLSDQLVAEDYRQLLALPFPDQTTATVSPTGSGAPTSPATSD